MDLKELLPDELKNDPALQDVPDVPTLAKAYRDTKAMVGASVRLPKDTSAEAQEEFLAAMEAKVPAVAELRKTVKAAAEERVKAAAAAKERSDGEVAADAALRKEWGAEYADKAAAARATAKAMGVPEAAVATMPPAQVRVWAATAARVTGSGNELGQQGKGGNGTVSLLEAKAQLAALRDDPKYWDGRHPEMHQKALELTKIVKAG